MKVILKKDVQHVGRAGQTLLVKDGFARNFLFPRKIAMPEKSQSLMEQKHKEKIAELKALKAEKARKEIFDKIQDLKISFQKATSPQGKLFGAITSTDVAQKLKESNFEIDKKFIQIKSPIKNIGDHTISVDLGKDMIATIQLSVQPDKKKKEEKISTLAKIARAFSSKKSEEPLKEDSEA